MSARWDLSAMSKQPAVPAGGRERLRSAVLDRFAATETRRQFSLEQVDEVRGDQAARITRQRIEAQPHSRSETIPAAVKTDATNSARRNARSAPVSDRSLVSDRSRANAATPRRSDATETRQPARSDQDAQSSAARDTRSTRNGAGPGERSADAVSRHAEAAGRGRTTHEKRADISSGVRPERTASTHADTAGASEADAETPAEGQNSESGSEAVASEHPRNPPRSAVPQTTRSNVADARSTMNPGTTEELAREFPPETPSGTEGGAAVATEAAETEAAVSDEAEGSAVRTSGLAVVPQPAPAPPVSMVQAGSAPTVQTSDATNVEAAGTVPVSMRGKAPGEIREASDGIGGAPSADDPQAGPTIAEAGFAAILDAADPAPSAGIPGAGHSTAAKAATSADGASAASSTQASAPPVPLGAVPMMIALRALRDTSRFEIRLDPVELGRIDVKLDIDKQAGTVSADLVVDRPATLALLQRDANALQQALSQAGLDASAGISVSLRDGASGGQDHGQDRGEGSAQGRQGQNDTGRGPRHDTSADTIDPAPLRSLRLSGLDIRI